MYNFAMQTIMLFKLCNRVITGVASPVDCAMASSTTVAMVTMTSTIIAQLALLCVVEMLLISATDGAKLGLNRYGTIHFTHDTPVSSVA